MKARVGLDITGSVFPKDQLATAQRTMIVSITILEAKTQAPCEALCHTHPSFIQRKFNSPEVRTMGQVPDHLVLGLGSLLPGCVTWSKLLHLCKPQFPSL